MTQQNDIQKTTKQNIIMKYLFTPSSNINYDFIVAIYFLFSFFCIGLYILETKIFIHYLGGETGESLGSVGSSSYNNESMKEVAESTQGLYMIFTPFIPCLLWSLVVHRVWKETNNNDGDKNKEKKE